MKRLACACLSIFLFFSLGCGKKPGEGGPAQVTVAFWGSPEEVDIITHSIEDWQKAHPEIKVVFSHTPYTGYDSKILTQIAGGAAPDIIATEVNYFVTFASKGVLENLSPFIEQDTDFKVDDFFPQIVDRFTVDGKLYAIPRDVAPFACVFYNKDLFDQAGIPYPTDDWTWDDLLSTARALTKKDANGRTVQYGFYGWAWQNFVYGNGGSLVDDPKHPIQTRIADPKTTKGLQFFADLANLYGVMPTPTALANLGMGVDLMFASGRLGMFLSGIWETPLLRNYKFKWDVVMFPKNREGIRAFGTGGSGYAILRSSKHKKEAWEVVKALTGENGQARLADRGLAQPARVAVAQSEHWATHPAPPANKGMLNEAVQYIKFDPFHPRWREIEDKFLLPSFELVFTGKKTAEEVAHEVEPKINRLLQEGKV
ncbi:MAG: sugar ABC transporter substrate-binding protein [Candidatus Omnitrophica bacterium]|nr:sugar ABC transporter substrate-binding protein [Candidatus Omnitrophota bacterium]